MSVQSEETKTDRRGSYLSEQQCGGVVGVIGMRVVNAITSRKRSDPPMRM